MLLNKLLSSAYLEFRLIGKNGETGYMGAVPEIDEIFCDSRQVVRRGLYIAFEGLHTDSHDYLDEAISHGASAVVVSRKAFDMGRVDAALGKAVIIIVEDCREAFSRIYAAWHSNPQKKAKFIGVTGTNGKTTVCRMIYEILSRSGHSCGLIGTAGNMISSASLGRNEPFISTAVDIKPLLPLSNMTTPDPPELYKMIELMQNNGAEYIIMEVTSHALALKKTAPIDFEIGVFTNLTEDHLDFHGDMESYFEAKKLLFGRCKRSIINIDDRYGRILAEEFAASRYTCSAEGRAADYNACDVRASSESEIEYKLSARKLRLRIRTKIPGMVTVMNTMQAAAVCELLGVAPREIKDAVAAIEGVSGRLEKLKTDEKINFSVYIDYAHTPDALENLLRSVRMFSKKRQRIVLLFGCGGEREVQKRATMGKIASEMSDFFVITSDNSRSESTSDIICDILSGVDPEAHYTVIEDRERAIEYLIKNARQGDIILLAGKGHEEYQIDSRGRRDFSERRIVSYFVKKYYG